MTLTFKNHDNGDTFRLKFTRNWITGKYSIYCLSHPESPFPLGVPAHLLAGDLVCVDPEFVPYTIDRAKAIALVWMRGFSHYIRTGIFPNGATRVNVGES